MVNTFGPRCQVQGLAMPGSGDARGLKRSDKTLRFGSCKGGAGAGATVAARSCSLS